MKPLKVRTSLILLFLFAAILPIIILSVLMVRQSYLDQIDGAKEQHLLVARSLSSAVDAFLNAHKITLETLADQMAVSRQPLSRRSRELAARLNRNYLGFRSIVVADRSGKVILEDLPPGTGREEPWAADWFINAKAAKSTYISNVTLDQERGDSYVTIATPIFTSRDEVLGIIAGDIDLAEIRKLLRGYRFGKTGFPVMIDRKGRILVHPNARWEKELKDFSHLPLVQSLIRSREGVLTRSEGLDGRMLMSGYSIVKSAGWIVGMPQSLSEVREKAFASVAKSLFWIPALLVFFILTAVFFARKISSPLAALAEASQAFERGEFTPVQASPGWLPGLEVLRLQTSFNQMASGIRQRTEEVQSLNRIMKLLSSGLNPRELFHACVQELRRAVKFDRIACHEIDEKGGMYRLYAVHWEPGVQAAASHPGPIQKGSLTEWLLSHPEPLVVEDFTTEGRFPWAREHYLGRGIHSCLAIPLVQQGRVAATLQWGSHESHSFGPSAVSYLTAFADAFSNAYSNSKLYEEQVETSKRLAVSNRIAEILASNLDMEKVYVAFAGEILTLVPYDSIQILLHDASAGELETVLVKGIPTNIKQGSRFKLDDLAGMKVAIESKRPFVRTDNTQAEGRSQVLDRTSFRSSLIVPLVVREKVVGVFGFLHRDPDNFREEHLEILSPIAEQLAIAMENSRLFKTTETLLQQQRLLSKVNSEISVLDLDQLLGRLVGRVRALFDVDVCFIRLVAPSGHVELKAIASSSDELKRFITSRGQNPRGVSSWVVGNKQSLFVNDAGKDPRFNVRFSSMSDASNLGLKAYMGVPIIARDQEVLGMIGVFSAGDVEFSADQLRFLEQVAAQAAIAIQNAQLYRDLEAANRWKEEVVANVSHELRTPLGVIIGNADLLVEGLFGSVTEKQAGAMGKIKLHASHLASLVNNLLTFSFMDKEGTNPSLTYFPAEEVLEPIRSLGVHHEEQRKNVTFSCETNGLLPVLHSDRTMLTAVLENLVTNAFKFTEKGRVRLQVRGVEEKREVEFSVSDTGIGIAEKDLQLIFDQFRQVDGSLTRRQGGFGLGLNLVKKYLEILRGEIKVQSTPGRGSTFTVSVPYEI